MTGGQKREVAIYLRMRNELAAGVRQAELTLGRFRERAHQEFRRLAAAVSIALIGAFTASAVAGAQFEQSLANVGSVARATAEEMAALEERALSLGETTAYTASQAADAMYSLASGGLDTAQIIATTEGVLKLAGATMSDMGQAAEITMSTMRQFNLEAEESERIVNVFGAGIQNSMLNMHRLADSMKYAGPVASGLNMSLEQTVAALALLHNAGLLGQRAGTGLSVVLTRLAAPTDDLKRSLRGLAVERDGLPAVIEQLRLANLTVGQMTAMFGQEALPAVMALTREGAAGLEQMTQAVTGTQAAWQMYDQQMDTTAGRWALIRSAIESTLLRAFKQIKPALNAAQDAILAWVNRSRDAIVGFAARAVDAFRDFLDAAGRVISYVREHQDTFIAAAKAIAVTTAAVYALSVAVGVVNAIMAANPVGLIIAGIAVLTAGVIFLVEKMGGWKVAWLEIRRVFALTVEYLRWGWMSMMQDFRNFSHTAEALKRTWQILWTAMKDGFEAFRSRFSESWSVLWSVIRDPRKIGDLGDIGSVWEGFGRDLSESLGAAVQDEIVAAWYEAAQKSNAASQDVWSEYVTRANDIERHYQAQIAAIRAARAGAGAGSAPEDSLGWEHFLIPDALPDPQEVYGPYRDEIAVVRREGERAFDAHRDAARLAAQTIGNDLVNALFDAKSAMIDLGNVARSVFGTMISGLISWGLGSIGPAGGFFDMAFGGGNRLRLAGANAFGGSVTPGGAYWVGERERELFVPHGSGQVIPESKLSGPKEVHHHYEIDVAVQVPHGSLLVADDSMAMKRLARTVGEEIDRSIKRTYKD